MMPDIKREDVEKPKTTQNFADVIRRRLAGDKKLAALVESEQEVELLTRQLAAANEKNMELTAQLLIDDEKRRIEGLIDEHGVVDEDLWCILMDQLAAKSAECEKLKQTIETMKANERERYTSAAKSLGVVAPCDRAALLHEKGE